MWAVLLHDDFAPEFRALDKPVQKAIAGYMGLLANDGPRLGRPYADTLKGSAHANMKELRLTVNKVEWRVAFAFDVQRQAILIAAAAKGGNARAYDDLIRTAGERFTGHQAKLSEARASRQR